MLRFFLSIIRTWWHSCTLFSSSAGLGFSFSFFACVFTSKLHVHEWMHAWIDDACVEQVPCMHELLYILILSSLSWVAPSSLHTCREGHRTNCMHSWSISRKFLCMHCRQTSCIRAFFSTPCMLNSCRSGSKTRRPPKHIYKLATRTWMTSS